ncbi:MAG: type IV secretion system protein [Alphaproteobacteria bacterium]|nr:type IV secretion system protein [Alphaproteobacteria bacterium]
MVEQISSDNTKKLLLEGDKVRANEPRPIRRSKVNSDVVVENATEKRYLWTARAFAVIFAISMCCNFILIYVIFAITPLYRVAPYLMSFADKGEQIYTIIPVNNIYEQKYLTEIFVREYILLRNTFVNDIDEMEKRWGPDSVLREMSSPGAYDKFYNEVAKPTIEKISQYNITRNIKIASVTEVGGEQGEPWWQVEFRMEDMAPSLETPRVSVWVASLKIKYRAKKVKFGERLKNPLGFTVLDYRQVKRETN